MLHLKYLQKNSIKKKYINAKGKFILKIMILFFNYCHYLFLKNIPKYTLVITNLLFSPKLVILV